MSGTVKTAWPTMFAPMSRQSLEADVCFENATEAFGYIKTSGTVYEGKVISIKSTSVYEGVEYLKGIYMITGYGQNASIMYACNGDNAKNKVEISCADPVVEYTGTQKQIEFEWSRDDIKSVSVIQKDERGEVLAGESQVVGNVVNVKSNSGKTILVFKFTFNDDSTETQEFVVEQIWPFFVGPMADTSSIKDNLSKLTKFVTKDYAVKIDSVKVEEGEHLIVFAPSGLRELDSVTSQGFHIPMDVKDDETMYEVGDDGWQYTIYQSEALNAGTIDKVVMSMEYNK